MSFRRPGSASYTTLVVHGGCAFGFEQTLTAKLDALLNAEEIVLSTPAALRSYQAQRGTEVTAPQRISLDTGLIYTKPNHQFSHGVQLAEQLSKSAKTVKQKTTFLCCVVHPRGKASFATDCGPPQ